MNSENYIEANYRELADKLNFEHTDLYSSFSNKKLREILSTLHHLLIKNYGLMNERLPTNDVGDHFWADPSRELLFTIGIITKLKQALKNSDYAFSLDPYYEDLINLSQKFLSRSLGSTIPPHMEKVELYYTIPIFMPLNTISISNVKANRNAGLKLIGEGSYAHVYKYKDEFYNKWFALKRSKKDLTSKEIERFKCEFKQMNDLNSPYIAEVYRYNEIKNEYIMELMDYSLDVYIDKNNSNLSVDKRKNIVYQILRAFQYIHSKNILHRDISPKNILLKEHEDVVVIKIADFGLVKLPDSKLTTINTEFKGYFNDPNLVVEGFSSYDIKHETYALTRLIYFVMTGKTNTSVIKDTKLNAFVRKGLLSDKSQRFQSVNEIHKQFREIYNK